MRECKVKKRRKRERKEKWDSKPHKTPKKVSPKIQCKNLKGKESLSESFLSLSDLNKFSQNFSNHIHNEKIYSKYK